MSTLHEEQVSHHRHCRLFFFTCVIIFKQLCFRPTVLEHTKYLSLYWHKLFFNLF